MALNEDQVKEMIFRILCAAEGANWEIYKIERGLNYPGSLMIDGDVAFELTTNEENEAAMEAFDRMENELYFVRWVGHVLKLVEI